MTKKKTLKNVISLKIHIRSTVCVGFVFRFPPEKNSTISPVQTRVLCYVFSPMIVHCWASNYIQNCVCVFVFIFVSRCFINLLHFNFTYYYVVKITLKKKKNGRGSSTNIKCSCASACGTFVVAIVHVLCSSSCCTQIDGY